MTGEKPIDPGASGFHSVMGYPELPAPRSDARIQHEGLSGVSPVPEVFLEAFNQNPDDETLPPPKVPTES